MLETTQEAAHLLVPPGPPPGTCSSSESDSSPVADTRSGRTIVRWAPELSASRIFKRDGAGKALTLPIAAVGSASGQSPEFRIRRGALPVPFHGCFSPEIAR